jgi:hypothetical protein
MREMAWKIRMMIAVTKKNLMRMLMRKMEMVIRRKDPEAKKTRRVKKGKRGAGVLKKTKRILELHLKMKKTINKSELYN